MQMGGGITSGCQVSALQRSGSNLSVQPNSPGVKGIPLATVTQKEGFAGQQTEGNIALCYLLCWFQDKEGNGGLDLCLEETLCSMLHLHIFRPLRQLDSLYNTNV